MQRHLTNFITRLKKVSEDWQLSSMSSSVVKEDMEDLELKGKFKKLQLKMLAMGITGDDLMQLDSIKLFQAPRRHEVWLTRACERLGWMRHLMFPCSVSLLLTCWLVLVMLLIQWPFSRQQFTEAYFATMGADMEKEPCLLDVTESVVDYLRPPVDCGMCRGLKAVDRVAGLTPEVFEAKYASVGRPVVVVDATSNWTALNKFSFDFFKSIYADDSPVLFGEQHNCQFFPYKTAYTSLSEVFNMSREQAQMQEGTKPWYIGWSNCDSAAANILRTHYSKPYFLPQTTESSNTDWIFMGCPGYGAHMHIDNVQLPSWQALVTGEKRWVLEPPPECYLECEPRLEVLLQQGDMIVINTNIWFHSTLILGNDISIAIGSEFD